MTEATGPMFLGRPLDPAQLNEMAMAWRPVGGVLMSDLKKWAIAAELTEVQVPQSQQEWRELASVLDRWVRSSDGRAYGADERGPGLWEEHIAGLEIFDIETERYRRARENRAFANATPPLVRTLSALADLHPWVAWMQTTNRAFPTDVVPRLFVRELGIFAHAHQHQLPWVSDQLLREGGVDPLGDPSVQTPRALAVLQEKLERDRSVM